MPRQGGLYIDINGEVSQRLLMSMERLKARLRRLSAEAANWSAKAKTLGQQDLSRGFDRMAQNFRGIHRQISNDMTDLQDTVVRGYTVMGTAAQKGSDRIVNVNKKAGQSFADLGSATKGSKEHLESYHRIQERLQGSLKGTVEGQRQLERRSRTVADQITRLHSAMVETGAEASHQKTLEQYAGNIDAARISTLEHEKQLKRTAHGYRALTEEAREALDLDPNQYDKLTQVFSRTEDQIVDLERRMDLTADKMSKLDFSDTVEVEKVRREINALDKEFNKLGPSIREMRGEEYFDGLNTSVIELKKNLAGGSKEYQKFAKAHQKVSAEMETYDQQSQSYRENLKRDIKRLQDYDFGKMHPEELRKINTDLNTLSKNFQGLKNTMPDDEFNELNNTISRSRTRIDRLLKGTYGQIDNLENRVTAAKKTFSELDFSDTVRVEEFRRELSAIDSEFKKLGPSIREIRGTEYFDDLNNSVIRVKQNLAEGTKESRDFAKAQQKVGTELSQTDMEAQSYRENLKRDISRLQDLDFAELHPEELRKINTDVNTLSRNFQGLKNTMPDDEFYNYNEILRQSRERISELTKKQTEFIDPIDDVRRKLEGFEEEMKTLDKLPIEQLRKVRARTRAWHGELDKLKGTMDDTTWTEYVERMRKVDNRLTKLIGSSSKYGQQAKDTRTLLQRLGQAFDQFSHKLLRQIHLWGLVGVVTVGAQAAYSALAVWAMKAAGSLSETADKLNMNVQEMQELQAAAVTTGTTTRDLREALESLNTTVIDAIEGKSKAKDAFDDLGIEFETLVKRGNDTEKMFELVMGKLDEVDSSAKKLSLAQDIFGEGPASTLINLVGDVEKAREAMRQFGITMSDEAAQDASNFWNKIRGLWLVIKRQFISASLEAIDVVDRFADQLLKAAKQGNIFEGTIVPAIKSTIGIFKSLYQAGRGLYWLLHRMYEIWDLLLIPIKALMGVGFVKFISYMTKGIQSYIASMTAANSITQRFFITLKTGLRFTGFYLLVEAIVRFVNWMGKAQRVAEETGLTISEAFRAVAEKSIEDSLEALKAAVPIIAQVFWDLASSTASLFWNKFIEEITSPSYSDKLSMELGKTSDKIKKDLESAEPSWLGKIFGTAKYRKGGGEEKNEEGGGIDLGIASEEEENELEKYTKRMQKKIGDVTKGLFDKTTEGAQKSRREMLKTAEVAEEASGDISDSIERMAKEGRVGDVEKFLPFAKDELEQKIEDTKEQLKVFREEIQRQQRLPGPMGEVDDELLQKYQQLQMALKNLTDQYQKLQTDIELEAQMNKFEEEFSNSIERAKLKYEEGSMELLNALEGINKEKVEKYREQLERATTGEEQASDKKVREIKNKLLKALNEIADIESDQLGHRYETIEKGAERNVEAVKNELKQREQLLEEQVARGEKYEEEAAVERAKAQEQASKEILEIRRREFERTKALLGQTLEEVKKAHGENSDAAENWIETQQSVEDAEQSYHSNKIQRLKAQQQEIEQTFQREKKLADQRRKAATAGMMDEQHRYGLGGGAEETGQTELEQLEVRYTAAKRHKERMSKLWDERLQRTKNIYGEDSEEYKMMLLKKEQYQKETNVELAKLEDKYRREQIRKNGSMWERMKLGANNFVDEYKDSMEDAADYTKRFLETTTSAFQNNLAAMIKDTKNFEQAWKDMLKSMLKEMADMLAQQVTQDFFTLLSGKGQQGGGDGNSWLKTGLKAGISAIGSYFGGGGYSQTGSPAGSTNLFEWGQGFSTSLNAKGNVFERGQKIAEYAKGGIVDQLTTFPMAKGAGVMGEAGPEAIMPLDRDKQGNLGVKTADGGSGTPNFEVNVVNKTGENAKAEKEGPKWDGEKYIMNVVLTAARNNKAGFKDNLAGHLSRSKNSKRS
mgnify:CR=1 FL=1